MDFLNFFNYVNYLHQEHIELKQKYAILLSIVSHELPGIKSRMETLEKHNIKIVQKKKHYTEQRYSCQYCGEKFDKQWELESHLVLHEEAEQFPCNVCDKDFRTKWRLKKHLQNHERKHVRTCKYFKKGQFCPFQKVGCKFLHNSSNVETENRNEKEQEQLSDDESKDENHLKSNKTNIRENDENKTDHRNDCQGCGQFPAEFTCVECSGRYCSECIEKDHLKNLHYCWNCVDDVV